MRGANRLYFFYGTLRTGQVNHQALLAGEPQAVSLGLGWTRQKYALYGAGIPFVFRVPELYRVRGEVFELGSQELRRAVDALEGHKSGRQRGYHREEVEIELDSGQRVLAWLYFYYGKIQAELFPSGDWLA